MAAYRGAGPGGAEAAMFTAAAESFLRQARWDRGQGQRHGALEPGGDAGGDARAERGAGRRGGRCVPTLHPGAARQGPA